MGENDLLIPTEEDDSETQFEATSASESKTESHKQTIGILAGALVLAAACLCLSLVFNLGFGFLGDDNAETVPTATPAPTNAPTATPVPTPEPDDPPIAVINGPTQAVVGQELVFDGSASTGSSPLVDFVWQFGDGTGARGVVVNHSYSRAGTYIITLTVTDQQGLSGSARVQIEIRDPEPTPEGPTAVIMAPSQAEVGERVTFDGKGSTSGNAIVGYTWDFGDGASGNGAVVDHTYSQPGEFSVTLMVTDSAGLSDTARAQITIEQTAQTPPTAVIEGPSEGIVGQEVIFSAASSQAGSSEISGYSWDLGNGQTKQGSREVTVTTSYNKPGQFTVTLTVIDDNGLSDTTDSRITIHQTLEEVSWYLSTAVPGTDITAQFDRGLVSGNAGCNDYSGTYELSAAGMASGEITISGLASSKKTCPEEVMVQEAGYLDNLGSVTSYAIQGSLLSLDYPGGTLQYSDQAP
ncbi:MAG: PKD domain-containing protein [Chloroflexota bacterium]|nr:PKD domain-containing protein [Chloroflexota bacterium]